MQLNTLLPSSYTKARAFCLECEIEEEFVLHILTGSYPIHSSLARWESGRVCGGWSCFLFFTSSTHTVKLNTFSVPTVNTKLQCNFTIALWFL